MSVSAHASSNVESVVLNDGSVVKGQEISRAHFLPLSKKIDFIELLEGSRVESNDIKSVNFKTRFLIRFVGPGMKAQTVVRTGGDGSGG